MPVDIEQPSQKKIVYYTEVFEANRSSKSSVVVNVGGAGSSKSYSIAQLFVEKLVNEDSKVFGVIRKTFPALRMTSYGLIIDLLKSYGVYREEKHNKTANTYTYKDSTIWFFSVDEAEKVKSTSFNYIWVEEASEISWDEFIVLKTRLRAPKKEGETNTIYLSLNPSDSFGWIPVKLCNISNESMKSA